MPQPDYGHSRLSCLLSGRYRNHILYLRQHFARFRRAACLLSVAPLPLLFRYIRMNCGFGRLDHRFINDRSVFSKNQREPHLHTVNAKIVGHHLRFTMFFHCRITHRSQCVHNQFRTSGHIFFSFESFVCFQSAALAPVVALVIVQFNLHIRFLQLTLLRQGGTGCT